MNDIQSMAAVVTTVVAVLGFVGMIYQLRRVDRDLRSAARGSIYDMAARLKEVFVERPELREFFFEDVEISEGHPEYPRVIAVADYYALYLEQITTQSRNIAPAHRDSWFEYVAGVYYRSPILRHYLDDKRAWYAQDFWDVIEGRRPAAGSASSQDPLVDPAEEPHPSP